MTSTDFHVCIGTIASKYEALMKENADLRAEIALLKAQLNVSQNEARPRRRKSSSGERLSDKKRQSSSFWQMKQKLKIDWNLIPVEFSDSLLCVNVGYDNNIAFGSIDAAIYVYSTTENRLITKVLGHQGAINCITAHPKAGIYASCSGDSMINIWSPQPLNNLMTRSDYQVISTIYANTTLSGHNGPVTSACWLDAEGHLISGSQDGVLLMWDVLQSKNSYRSESLKSPIRSVDVQYDTDMPIAVGTASGEITLIDSKSPDSKSTLTHGNGSIVQVKYTTTSNAKNFLISGNSDEKINVWDLRSPNIPFETVDINRVCTKFTVHGDNVVIPCEIGKMRILNLLSMQYSIIESTPFSYTVSEVNFVNDNTIVAASWDGSAAMGRIDI